MDPENRTNGRRDYVEQNLVLGAMAYLTDVEAPGIGEQVRCGDVGMAEREYHCPTENENVTGITRRNRTSRFSSTPPQVSKPINMFQSECPYCVNAFEFSLLLLSTILKPNQPTRLSEPNRIRRQY